MIECLAAIESLKGRVQGIHEASSWAYIKPTGENQQRVNEYTLQARADLKRCIGNLERAERELAKKVEVNEETHAS